MSAPKIVAHVRKSTNESFCANYSIHKLYDMRLKKTPIIINKLIYYNVHITSHILYKPKDSI